MSWQILTDIREIFVELTAFEDGKKPVATYRSANRKDQMLFGLKECLAKISDTVPFKAAKISVRTDHPHTLWDERWHATQALITLDGSQHFFELGYENNIKNLGFKAQKKAPPVALENSFGVSLEKELLQNELIVICEKLKLAEIENVVVCISHSSKNPETEIFIESFLKNQGLSVETSHKYPGRELERATLASKKLVQRNCFKKITTDLIELGFQEGNITLTDEIEVFDNEVLFLEDRLMVKSKDKQVLELGFSPLAPLYVDQNGIPQFEFTKVSSEPGPVCFGKGVQLTWLDLIVFKQNITFENFLRIKTDQNKIKKHLQLLAQQLHSNIDTTVDMFLKQAQGLIRLELKKHFMKPNEVKFKGLMNDVTGGELF